MTNLVIVKREGSRFAMNFSFLILMKEVPLIIREKE